MVALHHRLHAQVAQVVVVGRLYNILVFLHPVLVHDDVVGNTDHPIAELSAIGVPAFLQIHDNLDEGILKDVVGYFAVAHDKEDIVIEFRLIACEQFIESLIVSIGIS